MGTDFPPILMIAEELMEWDPALTRKEAERWARRHNRNAMRRWRARRKRES